MTPGGAASGRKGSTYERELVSRFDAAGWGSLRLPSSGSATERELPDVLAGKPMVASQMGGSITATETLAIELKSGKATTLYISGREVDALNAFARTWGARPLLGARFTTQGSSTDTFLVPPDAARETETGYGLPVVDIEERAVAVVGEDGVRRCD